MKRTGAVVYMDGSSFAERDFPSAVFFILVLQKKSPIPRRVATGYRALGFKTSGRARSRIEKMQLNFVDHFCDHIFLQRHDYLPFAPPAFQLDSARHQARQHAAAQATKGFYPRVIVAGLILAVLLQHSFLCLVRPFGFLWPSRPKSLQMPAASNLGPPAFQAWDIFPKTALAEETRSEWLEPIQRLGVS